MIVRWRRNLRRVQSDEAIELWKATFLAIRLETLQINSKVATDGYFQDDRHRFSPLRKRKDGEKGSKKGSARLS